MANNDPVRDPKSEARVREIERAKDRIPEEVMRIGVDMADAVRIAQGKKISKKRDASKVPTLDQIGEAIARLEVQAKPFRDSLKAEMTQIADLRASFDEAYERVTGAAAPTVDVASLKHEKLVEAEQDLSVLGVAEQFTADLNKKFSEYSEGIGAIRKHRVVKEKALIDLASMEADTASLETDWQTWKMANVSDVDALPAKEKTAILEIDQRFFDVKVRHEKVLEAANAMVDPEPEPVREPVRQRGSERREEFESDEAVERRVRSIVNAYNVWNPELEGKDNAAKRWSVVERYVREGKGTFDLAPYFLNADMASDFQAAMDPLVDAYRVILPKKEEARQAERAKRDAERTVEVKNPLGYLGKAKFWKEDVSGRDRNEMIKRLVSGDVPDDELGNLLVGGSTDVARLRSQIESLRDRIVEQFAAQKPERKATSEQREAGLPTLNEIASDQSLWKTEIPYEQRKRIVIDCGLGRVSADELTAFIPNDAAGEKIFEAAFRFKQEEMDAARGFLDGAAERIVKITTEFERLATLPDDQFNEEEAEAVAEALRRLKRSVLGAREQLIELGEASADLAKYDELRVLGEKAEEKLERLYDRAKDPAEVLTNAVVNRDDLWNDDVSDDVRNGLFIAAVNRTVLSSDPVINQAVKNLDAFTEEVKRVRKHLSDRGLLAAEAAVPLVERATWTALPTEAKIEKSRADLEAQHEKILAADYWAKGISRDEREALIAPESIPTLDALAKLEGKMNPLWKRTAKVALERLVKIRRSLAMLEAQKSRDVSVVPEVDVVPAVLKTEAIVAPEAGPTPREKAIAEHAAEIKKMLARDAFWNPSFGGDSNRGVRGAVIARILKGHAGPKPENLRDPEQFAKISAFTSWENFLAQYKEVTEAYDAAMAKAAEPASVPTPETREAPPVARPEVPVAPVRPPRAVEAAPVALPPRRMSPARPPETLPPPREVGPAVAPVPPIETRPVVAARPAPERLKAAPSTSAERYFERARASRFRLEDDDVEQRDEPPMRAQEKTSSLAKRATSWLRGVFGRGESAPEAEPSAVSPQAQAATGSIAAAGRIFGYSAFRGITDRIAGISSEERKVIDGAVNRAAAQEREARSAEATIERRYAANSEMISRLERSVDAAPLPESDKASMRQRLAEARRTYGANVDALGERREARVAAEFEAASRESQPSLRARGANFLRERGFTQLAEAIGPEGGGRDASLVARVVEAFREGFRNFWSRTSPATIPTSDALRTLGDRVGTSPRLTSVDAATLAGNVGGSEDKSESARRLQQDIDAVLDVLRRDQRSDR